MGTKVILALLVGLLTIGYSQDTLSRRRVSQQNSVSNSVVLPIVTIVATDSEAGEPGTGKGTGTFTISRTTSNTTISINGSIATSGNGADILTDFTLNTYLPFAFVSGMGTTNITLTVIDDSDIEVLSSVTYSISGGTGYQVGSPSSATITIADDDVAASCNISFTNLVNITIPDSGNASVYPSTITVSNTCSTITNISLTINGFTHTYPDDVDILLVGPYGQKSIVMSDCGGFFSVTNLSLVFNSLAASSLPNDAPALISGTYLPTDSNDGTDTFSSPAPSGPYTADFTVFNGTNPNGIWYLYIVDDFINNTGSITNWVLNIKATP